MPTDSVAERHCGGLTNKAVLEAFQNAPARPQAENYIAAVGVVHDIHTRLGGDIAGNKRAHGLLAAARR